jgi:hypothetical protein
MRVLRYAACRRSASSKFDRGIISRHKAAGAPVGPLGVDFQAAILIGKLYVRRASFALPFVQAGVSRFAVARGIEGRRFSDSCFPIEKSPGIRAIPKVNANNEFACREREYRPPSAGCRRGRIEGQLSCKSRMLYACLRITSTDLVEFVSRVKSRALKLRSRSFPSFALIGRVIRERRGVDCEGMARVATGSSLADNYRRITTRPRANSGPDLFKASFAAPLANLGAQITAAIRPIGIRAWTRVNSGR